MPLPRGLWAVLSTALCVACHDATQTTVVLDFAALRDRSVSLRVRACNQDGVLTMDRVVPLVGSGAPVGPARVPFVPERLPARRFSVLGELLNADGEVVARQRVIAGFETDQHVQVRRTFDEVCVAQPGCGWGETCTQGACAPAAAPGLPVDTLPCVPELACTASTCPGRLPYPTGFAWNRRDDWTAGVRPLGRAGNPAPDAHGTPAWQYEVVEGGADRQSGDAWFRRTGQLLVWDPIWFTETSGAWARGDNLGPDIARDWLDHLMSLADQTPRVRWLNPTGRDVVLDITGAFNLIAQSQAAGRVEIVIARVGPSQEADPLFAEERTLAANQAQSIPVQLRGVSVAASQSLWFSHRGSGTSGWFTLSDNLTFTLVDGLPR